MMGLFGFGKKKDESAPVCACQCGCAVSEGEKETGTAAGGVRSIKVLGAGCTSCHALLENTKEAAAHMGLGTEVEYVTDMEKIAGYGVMRIPALVVNEQVVAMGKVLKTEDVAVILKKVQG